MALNSQVFSLVTGYAGFFLVLLNSIPASKTIAYRVAGITTPTQYDELRMTKTHYSDEDGEASDSSLREFSDKWQRIAIGLLSVIGLEISLGLAIITTAHAGIEGYVVQSWLQVAVWICLGFQSVAFFIESSPTVRYSQGKLAFWASVLTFLIPCIELGAESLADNHQSINQASTGLVVTQVAIALCRGACCLLIPRRPDVFLDGTIVDQQYTVSLLCRFTFSWVNELLQRATQKKGLEIGDLPALPSAVRPRILHNRFEKVRRGVPIWKALIIAHWESFALQITLALVSCALSFGPEIALYEILKCLESRGSDSWNASRSWMWVIAMGCFMLLSAGIDSWLFWIVYSKIGVPIYEELAAMVFAKSMRRKDIKDMKTRNQDDTSTMHSSMSSAVDTEEENEHGQQTLQSIINYAAVDSKRVADFATYSYLMPHAVLRLLIACGILLNILGLMSLLGGLLVGAVVGPINTHLAQKYAQSQDDLMKSRDQRTDVVSEALQGIRQIKFSALEGEWEKRIAEKRHSELQSLWTSFLYSTGLISIWILGPLMLSAASLTVYTMINGGLTAPVAFTAMAIFGSLELSLASLPGLLSRVLEAKVSSDRIDKYMDCPEKPLNTIPAPYVSFEAASVAWPAEDNCEWEAGERFVLRNVNLRFPPKGLSVISGKTGSGKSLLLASILGECDILAGKVNVPAPPHLNAKHDCRISRAEWIIDNAIAYVAQNPWIEIGTIRDNILFGLPYHPGRYQKVLFASGLDKDVEMLPDKEMTDIGANGVNLSGGQRWRVSFARALYSRAGILIMDDIFSALDAHTGRHVYDNALTGELGQGRTRILVTHHASLCLPRTDYSVLLDNGTVKHAGTVEELQRDNSLSDLLVLEGTVRDEVPCPVESPDKPETASKTSLCKEHSSTRKQTSNTDKLRSLTSRRNSVKGKANRRSHVWGGNATTMRQSQSRKVDQEEKSGSGSVSLAVCIAYIRKGGSISFWALVLGAYVAYTCLILGRSWWMQIWTNSPNSQAKQEHHSLDVNNAISHHATAKGNDNLFVYLGVYVGISVLACVVGTAKYFALMMTGIEASKNLFNDLTYVVLRAPLRWLDTVPLGRILNRFTADIYTVDVRLGYDIGVFIEKVLEVCGIMLAGMVVSPFAILFAMIVLAICLKLSLAYLAGAREVKRLESVARSPIFEHFDSSLAGLATIRAFNKVDPYIETMYSKISVHARTAWNLWLFNMWLDYRMSVVGAFFSTITAALVVYFPSIPASLAGFGLSFALKYNNSIVMVLRQYASVELDMNATERVIEYSKIETENQDGMIAPAFWPTEGKVEVVDLVIGYAPDLPPVLNGLSFTMERNQRVAVVGRSGAGKSSLALALFRFLEARQGHIYIDGMDVSKINLRDLRSRLAIIPQDPVLFSGTVRSNLDPFNEHSDSELYDAMERVNLFSFGDTETLASDSSAQQPTTETRTPGSMEETLASSRTSHNGHMKENNNHLSLFSTISEGGMNLSQGQRQLLCLARAIVAQPKVMILDEATSAVDMETDALIQRSIRAEFGRNASTLLVIAHRLSTIADFDRIVVMDAGKAVEFGSPRELMKIEGGMFRSLVEDSGERGVLEHIILGKETVS